MKQLHKHIKNLNNIAINRSFVGIGIVSIFNFINTLLHFQPKLNINIHWITTMALGKCVGYLLRCI